MTEIGTLKELNVKTGDVIEWCIDGSVDTVISVGHWADGISVNLSNYGRGFFTTERFCIISRASDEPKLWSDMTNEEKGELLLANLEGKIIQHASRVLGCGDNLLWQDCPCNWEPKNELAYRVKPDEPVRETFTHEQWVSMHSESNRGTFSLLFGPCSRHDTKGQTTIETVDGKPVKVVWEASDYDRA